MEPPRIQKISLYAPRGSSVNPILRFAFVKRRDEVNLGPIHFREA